MVRIHCRVISLMKVLSRHPQVSIPILQELYRLGTEELRTYLRRAKGEAVAVAIETGVVPVSPSDNGAGGAFETAVRQESVFRQIQQMNVAEKVRFALHAGKEARSLLLKDPNRQVAMAVIDSPKITEDEIVMIAQSRNVSDDILRAIVKKREWLKNYAVCLSLVSNPKTPVGISMAQLPGIRNHDLALISKNKGVPEAIRTAAQRLLQTRTKQS
jgi:hypothetical protein